MSARARERDPQDPNLILPGGRRRAPQPSRNRNDVLTIAERERLDKQQTSKDASKPDGEACRADGTLKDASEMEWPDSPTSNANSHSSQSRKDGKRDRDRDDEDKPDSEDELPRPKKRALFVISDAESDTENVEDPEDVEDPSDAANELASLEKPAQAQPRRQNGLPSNTKDLRLCGEDGEGVHEKTGELVNGWYCSFCLVYAKAHGKSADYAFFSGNRTSQRRHLLRAHLDKYWAKCEEHNHVPVPPKDWKQPQGWVPPSEREAAAANSKLKQQSITGFTQKIEPVLKVSKAGLKEHLLAIMATCDLSFRFCEKPAVRGLILYLNRKLSMSDIPGKSTMADMVMAKVDVLEKRTREILRAVPSKLSLVWDGWSTKNRRPFTSVLVTFVSSPPNNDTQWTLKKYLIEFNSPAGRHTGELIGQDLLATMRKFGIEDKVGWFVGDGVSSNDVAVRAICQELDPFEKRLKPKQARILCIDHSMHRAAYHFIKTLSIPSLTRTKKKLRSKSKQPGAEDDSDGSGDEDDDAGVDDGDDGVETGEPVSANAEEEDDVSISMEIDASSDDPEEMAAAACVDFMPGDALGKLLALMNQVRMSSEGVREYLDHACKIHDIMPVAFRLWIRTRWGSFSHCLESALSIETAVDYFCLTADKNKALPPLQKGKKWRDYQLSQKEWKLIKLTHHCLKIVAKRHNELSVEDMPTCTKVYPMMEMLMSDWEDLLDVPKFEPVHDALRAGIKLMEKYYRRADDTDVYFISHVLDPERKLQYLDAAWDESFIEAGMEAMREKFLIYKARYSASRAQSSPVDTSTSSGNDAPAAVDEWMDKLQKRKNARALASQDSVSSLVDDEDPFEELNRWFKQKPSARGSCPDPIAWWGHNFEFPVLRMMARDYLPVPATTCIAERAFSFAGRTDDPRRQGLKKEKFGGLQKIHAGYLDGRLSVEAEILSMYKDDFSFNHDDYVG